MSGGRRRAARDREAPEALEIQSLDSRVDLFSLGALAYFVLSGRHAYPARSLAELRDVWRSRPPALTRLVPDIPPALDALVSDVFQAREDTRVSDRMLLRTLAEALLARGDVSGAEFDAVVTV